MPLFFGLKRPIEASIDIVALTGVTGYLTFLWGQVDQVAGWCLAPYLGWLSFATYLSVSLNNHKVWVFGLRWALMWFVQIGTGYLNGWDFSDKKRSMPPGGDDTKYVNEAGK